MTKRLVCAAVAFLCLIALEAGVVPGRWDKVEALESGAPIVIRLFSGDLVEGTFQGLRDGLLVTADSGSRRETPTDVIQEVSTRRGYRSRFRFWNAGTGALVGFGIGAAIGFAGGDDGVFDDFTGAGAAIILGGVGAGGGALTGQILKTAGEAPQLLYVARARP